MGTLSLRLDEALEQQLDREAERESKSRSEIARDALASYLRERERRRFQDEIVRAARALEPAEARAIAAEALPTDNEAMGAAPGVSEPGATYAAAGRKAKRRAR